MSRLYIMLATAVIAFGAGWQTNSWYEDSKDLAAKIATAKTEAAFQKAVSDISSTVETKLEGLRANERIIERWRTKVVDRPVYNIDCIDDDGLRLIEAYATGKPAELTGKMSERSPGANGENR